MRKDPGQRGVAAVEAAFVLPVVLLLVAGGLQLGIALVARHQLGDAAAFAARKVALNHGDTRGITGVVADRMSSAPGFCQSPDVSVSILYGPVRHAKVTARCTMEPLHAKVGTITLSATSAVPY